MIESPFKVGDRVRVIHVYNGGPNLGKVGTVKAVYGASLTVLLDGESLRRHWSLDSASECLALFSGLDVILELA